MPRGIPPRRTGRSAARRADARRNFPCRRVGLSRSRRRSWRIEDRRDAARDRRIAPRGRRCGDGDSGLLWVCPTEPSPACRRSGRPNLRGRSCGNLFACSTVRPSTSWPRGTAPCRVRAPTYPSFSTGGGFRCCSTSSRRSNCRRARSNPDPSERRSSSRPPGCRCDISPPRNSAAPGRRTTCPDASPCRTPVSGSRNRTRPETMPRSGTNYRPPSYSASFACTLYPRGRGTSPSTRDTRSISRGTSIVYSSCSTSLIYSGRNEGNRLFP
mmetsp:Transcript_3857/g.7344  ORF Transcript_3857/g.7344 Transcript_3857/m.7344 type:complete len:270 (+) Transcript_3857:536-1345(+)